MADEQEPVGGANPEATDPSPPKSYKELFEKVQSRERVLQDKWIKKAAEYYEIYEGCKPDETPFNILFSNTEILAPAVLSQKPTARVLRRWDDSRADIPAKAVQRMLTFCMDTNLPSMPDFMTCLEDSVLDATVPGQGLIRVRLLSSIACLDLVLWNKFIWGYCARWEDCPWIAFRHDKTPTEVIESFQIEDPLVIAKLKSSASSEETDPTTDEKRPATIAVYETWVKKDKVIHWLCDAIDTCCLTTDPDPFGLENFYPIPPKPLTFVHSTTDTLPRPLYNLYKQQAQELNEITIRLRKIIRALKVRGIYAANISDIPKIFEEDDNVLIPSEAASQVLMDGKGLDSKIWLLPIDKLIIVTKELYEARERVKSTIYEILGIGDILRGVSKASETLGAQQIKDKWGSLRVNKARNRTSEFVCEGLRLLAEVAVKKTPPEMWAAVTGMDLASPVETGAGVVGGQQLPPDQTWPGVLATLQNDLKRAYIIDVETNSTVDSEATQDKQETIEFMNAFGQAMSGLEKLMMSSPEGFEAGKSVLLGVVNKFKLGEEVSPLLMKLKPPQRGLTPEQQKAQADLQKAQQDLQKREQALVADEQALKDLTASAGEASSEVKQATEALQRDREALRKEQDFLSREIYIQKQEALLEIKTAAMDAQAKALQVKQSQQQPRKPQPARA